MKREKLEVAMFDFDKTLIPVSSGTLLIKKFLELNLLSKSKALKLTILHFLFRFGLVDVRKAMLELLNSFNGSSEKDFEKILRNLFYSDLIDLLSPEARAEISRHKKENRKLIIVSNNMSFMLYPALQEWGFDEIVANELSAVNGVLDGEFSKEICVHEGKFNRLKELSYFSEIDFENSYFYTDSIYDRELLEKVGKPVVVNADYKLEKWAKKKGIKTLLWS